MEFLNCKRSILREVLLALTSIFTLQMGGQELSSVKGGLGGVVADTSGAIIPSAKVIIVGAADTREVITDENGRFSVPGLTPGQYSITIEKAAFSTAEAKDVEVVINRISNINFTLTTGKVSETVVVTANNVGIDSSSNAIGTNLSDTFYSQVPIQRNVGSLFYVAPGVVDGGGTGRANPSIGGATGLENSYIADGVGINDSGYGGLGVYSPVYGSLGSGINLSFVQEVQVKTGAFEPKYGKVNGGVVQLVTKSGGNKYHGAIAAYFAPEGMGAGYYNQDAFRTSLEDQPLQRGFVFSQPAYDASLEFGGYIPIKGMQDKFFFFGAFNPVLNQVRYRAPNLLFSSGLYNHGPLTTSITTYNWAAKLTYNLTGSTSLEASAFGDPSRSNKALTGSYVQAYPQLQLQQHTDTAFSRWDFGSRSIAARLNSSLSPTALLSIAATYKTSHFTESDFANTYGVSDRTVGIRQFQGLGIYQNPVNHSYGFGIDFQKIVPFEGQHTFSVGWGFDRAIYNATRDYSGSRFPFPATNVDGTPIEEVGGQSGLAGSLASASFYLANAPAGCPTSLCPVYDPQLAGSAPRKVYLRQVRGIFSSPNVSSSQAYHAIYGNDSWSINPRVTINAGLRWDEEQLSGPNQQYVFNGNWSPRLGINFDPWGDRKTKIFFNWGRYTQALPTDAAIRTLNQELDVFARWAAPSDPLGHLVTNPDGGTIPITLDAAHLLSGSAANGFGNPAFNIVATPSTPELIHSGTRLNFEEEYVAGFERQFGHGLVFSARYSDRRLLRILEDMGGISPEGANAGVPQIFIIGNPSPSADYYVNEQEIAYTGTAPANCTVDYGEQQDTLGNDLGAACSPNAPADLSATPGTAGFNAPDGLPDGFASPSRRYQALELELNKNFSHNYMIRVNYRYAKLFGNYEGLFRNDNNQSDPGISSLFDFTTGTLNLLGSQFSPGYLNTDRRHVGNIYGSYTVPNRFAKGLTAGFGVRGSSGVPLNRLGSHPVYQNVGEIPFGGRGTAGRTPSALQLDLHTDYPVSLGEKAKLKLAFDMFNVSNSRYTTNTNQNIDTGFQLGADPTYGTPTSFQRAFYARGGIRLEF
jgi:Carboxypeptidase regulatory-like domain